MWELDHTEGSMLKNRWFWTVVLEKTLESHLDCKKIKPANLKAMTNLWKSVLKSRDITLPTNVHIVKAMAFPAVMYECELLLFSSSVLSSSLRPHGLQHTRLHCPLPSPRACSNSCQVSRWCHPTISFSVIPLSSCFQSYPVPGSFLMSQFFTSGGQSIGASASASVLSMTIQGWFPLGLTGLISLQSKELSRVFTKTTVQKH